MAGPGGSEHGRINIKVVPDTDGFTRKVDALLAKYSKEKIEIKVEADTKQAEAELAKLKEKYDKLTIKVEVDSKKAKAELEKLAKNNGIDIKANANTKRAEAQIKRATRDRTVRIQYRFAGDEAVRRVQALTRDKVQRITLEFDKSRALARLRAIGDDSKIVANVEVDQRNIKDIKRWIGSLGRDFKEVGQELNEGFKRALATQERLARRAASIKVDVDGAAKAEAEIDIAARDRKTTIEVDVDRDRLNRAGMVIGRAFSGAGSMAQHALAGTFRGLATLFSLFGRMGNLGQAVFGNLANSIGGASAKMSNLATVIAQVVAMGAVLGVVLSVLAAIINTLGALIVAAVAALAAIGSVVLGAAALLALPGIFAGVAAALISMGDENDKVKKQFTQLAKTIRSTVTKTAKPMLDLFSDSLESLNKNLQKGTPLYKELSTAFDQSARALEPLREGLGQFTFQTLRGFNDALRQLNSNGTFEALSTSIGGLGNLLGNFARTIGQYGPQFAVGFASLVSGLDRITQSLGHFMGAFSGDSVGTIDAFSDALSNLLLTFSKNATTYTNAAEALGNAIDLATPGFEKITAAFANMSPGIMYSIADAINRLGDTMSDPKIQQGLLTLTQGVITFAAAVANTATKISSSLGNTLHDYNKLFSSITGAVKITSKATQKDFSDIISKQDEADKKVSAGLRQLSVSMETFAKSTQRPEAALRELGWASYKFLADHNQFTGAVKQNFLALQNLEEKWVNNRGILTDAMRKEFEGISKAVDQTANPALKRYRDGLKQTFDQATKNAQEMKASLIKAFEDAGIQIKGTQLEKQIDQMLGNMTTSAQEKSQQAISAIQQNFALLPGIVRTAMDEARTPQELETRLKNISGIVERFTPEIAKAFGKLPESMKRTLTESTSAFETWTGLETFRQKVATGVQQAVAEFNKIGPAANNMSQQLSGASLNIAGFNAQANWLNWILNQVGAQAQWAGWQMGQISANAGRAAGSVARLNSGANGLSGAFNRAGSAASSMSGRINALGHTSASASAGFATFAGRVSGYMVLAHQSVGSWTYAIEQRLSQMQRNAGNFGRLTSFVSSISSSMTQAKGIVSSAVSEMLAQLQRLNTTVTARVRVETEKVPSTNDITPNVVPNVAPSFMPMSAEFTPMALSATVMRDDSTSAALGAWQRTAEIALREGSKSRRDEGPSVVKNYTFNNEIYGPAPTEKRLIKQMRFTDTLFGDD